MSGKNQEICYPASIRNHTRLIEDLLRQSKKIMEQLGAQFDSEMANYAAKTGNLNVLNWLVDRGIKPNDIGLYQAIQNGQVKVLTWMERHGYKISSNETVEAWRAALLNRDGPTALIFTRQRLPVLDRSEHSSAEGVHRGAYVLWQSGDGTHDVILIGTGSEVHIALEAGAILAGEGVRVRVVSMPSWELFDWQPVDYRESVLPAAVRARVAVEAGIKLGWERYVGLDGAVVGLECFGASAPGHVVYEKLGFTAENVAAQARKVLKEVK